MKNRFKQNSSLFLLELLIILLFFSISAAICLSIFSDAQTNSLAASAISNATIEAQNAAEAYKANAGNMAETALLLGGTLSNDTLEVGFDRHWKKCALQDAYFVLKIKAPVSKGGSAHLTIFEDGASLISFALGALAYE